MPIKTATVTYILDETADEYPSMFAAAVNVGNETLEVDEWNFASEIAREALLCQHVNKSGYDSIQEVVRMVVSQNSNTATANTINFATLYRLRALYIDLLQAIGNSGDFETNLLKLPAEEFQGFGRDLIQALNIVESSLDHMGYYLDGAKPALDNE